MLQQIIRAARLDRSFYSGLLYDDYAVGNGVLFVGLLGAIPGALALDFFAAAFGAISMLVRAAIVGVAAWAVAIKMLHGEGRIPTTIRLTLFAHVAFIPLLVAPWVPALSTILFIGVLVWFFLEMRVVASVQFDLRDTDTMTVAGLSVLAFLVALLLRA
jgi:hypothetical protein